MLDFFAVSVFAVAAVLWIISKGFVPHLTDKLFRKVPPGPFSLPVFGTAGIDSTHSWITFTKWAKQYGGIFSLFLGSEFAVVLSDINVIRAALSKSSFEGRPLNALFKNLFHQRGLGFVEGEFWREQRKFAVHTLHKLATNSVQPENSEENGTLQDIYSALVADFGSIDGRPFDPMPFLHRASVLVCCDVVHKGAVRPGDPVVDEIIALYKSLFAVNANTGWMTTHPWLMHIPPYRQSYWLMEKAADQGRQLARKCIERVKKTRQNELPVAAERELADFVTAFQEKIQDETSEKSFTEEQLIQMAAELVMAGEEDIHVVMYWMVLFMCMHPSVQQKAQELLDKIVGPSRQPTLQDRCDLGYIDGIVLETLRFSNFAPFPLPRRTTESVQLSGFYIPKDTTVVTNAYAVHFHKDLWGDPEVFRPERFMNDEGKFAPSSNVLAFGTGRRVCVAETFAKVQMSALLSAVLHNFTLGFPQGDTPPDIRQNIVGGLVMVPKPYRIIATGRRSSSGQHGILRSMMSELRHRQKK